MWVIWIRCNASIFKNTQWSVEQLERALWDATVDLARTSWLRVQWLQRHQPLAARRARREFMRQWAQTDVLCSVQGD